MKEKRLFLTVARTAGALVALIVLLLWFSGFFETKIDPEAMEMPDRAESAGEATATVEEVRVPVTEEAAGTVQAERKTIVSSRIVATIRELRVVAGDQVAAGDLLVLLDDRELDAAVQEARRGVDGAEATRTRAKSDFDRVQKLFQERVVSRGEFDQAQSTFRVADAQLERARQSLERARVELSYAEIRATASGRVIDRLADPGDTALPGKPLLSLYDPTALRMEVPVRERLVGGLSVGQRLQVVVGTQPDAIEGVVDEVVPQAEAGSRTFLVKVGLPRREGIYTGMFGRVLIPAGERTRLLIPAAAVHRVGQLDFVEVTDEDGRRTRRLVTLGPAAPDDRIEVLSGLEAGETVLLQPAARD